MPLWAAVHGRAGQSRPPSPGPARAGHEGPPGGGPRPRCVVVVVCHFGAPCRAHPRRRLVGQNWHRGRTTSFPDKPSWWQGGRPPSHPVQLETGVDPPPHRCVRSGLLGRPRGGGLVVQEIVQTRPRIPRSIPLHFLMMFRETKIEKINTQNTKQFQNQKPRWLTVQRRGWDWGHAPPPADRLQAPPNIPEIN